MASYADERTAAIRARNAQSKARSRQMERNVANFLGGHRIPMSGSGSLKGDCEVVTDKVGRIYIECKYSAQRLPAYGPTIRIDFRWFDKMRADAIIMKAKIAALVFQYHDVRNARYVIVPIDVVHRYDCEATLAGAYIIDAGEKNGYNMHKRVIETAFAENLYGREIALLRCDRGDFALMTLAQFKDIIHVETNCE